MARAADRRATRQAPRARPGRSRQRAATPAAPVSLAGARSSVGPRWPTAPESVMLAAGAHRFQAAPWAGDDGAARPVPVRRQRSQPLQLHDRSLRLDHRIAAYRQNLHASSGQWVETLPVAARRVVAANRVDAWDAPPFMRPAMRSMTVLAAVTTSTDTRSPSAEPPCPRPRSRTRANPSGVDGVGFRLRVTTKSSVVKMPVNLAEKVRTDVSRTSDSGRQHFFSFASRGRLRRSRQWTVGRRGPIRP